MLSTYRRRRFHSRVYTREMTDKINSYFAVLIITIFGAGATLIIVHVADSSAVVTVFGNSSSTYTYLQ